MKIYLASPHSYPGMIAEMIGGGTGDIFKKQGDKEAMKIFLAGGVSGNLNPAWKDIAHGKGWDDALASFLSRNRESALDPSPDG